MSKDQVSRICRELDGQVEAFRSRPLEGAYPYLWLDAKHLKVRDRGHVHSKALMVVVARGLQGVRLCASDDHLGLKAAIAKVFNDESGARGGRNFVPAPTWQLHHY